MNPDEYSDELDSDEFDFDDEKDVDESPAEPVENAPDPEQAAEPVEHQHVVGRRNPDLPTENLETPPTNV